MEYPSWFKPETGFRFRDPDGDECVFLGKQVGYRRTDTVATKTTTSDGEVIKNGVENVLKFIHDVDVFVYKYKNEWHLGDIEGHVKNEPNYLNECMSEEDWRVKNLEREAEWNNLSPAERSRRIFEGPKKATV